MPTIEQQLALENVIVEQGMDMYHGANKKAEESGRGSGTGYARRLHQMFVDDLTSDLEMYLEYRAGKPGPGGKYVGLIRRLDPRLCVQIGLQELFDNVFAGGRGLQDALVKIGMRLEDDLKFGVFRKQEPDYFNTLMKGFKSRGTTEYRHIHRVLTKKMHDFDVEWLDWSTLERARVGELIAEVLITRNSMYKPLFYVKKAARSGKKHVISTLSLTEYAEDWLEEYKEHAQYLRPPGAPMIIKPLDWESLHHGGFYSPQLQSKFPFVRTRHLHKIEHGDFSKHFKAVNRLQATAWRINSKVSEFMQWAIESGFDTKVGLPSTVPYEFPVSPVVGIDKEYMCEDQRIQFLEWKRETAQLHTDERKRYSEATAVWRLRKMVDDYAKYKEFFFVYTCDFRGRVYPVTTGLSPQGADYSKGLLQFSKGKALGAAGWFWLRVQGANTFGYDTDTYEGRVRYINEMSDSIRGIANDPCCKDSVDIIAQADKPIQFLAFCFDYAAAYPSPYTYVSHLPVGLDGSCNGLQHFSAILRDPVAGLATNVLPCDRPNDLYGQVAEETVRTLNDVTGDGATLANKVVSLGIGRYATKRSVMTLPYGLSKHSSGEYVGEWLRSNHGAQLRDYTSFNTARNLLNEHIWEAIGNTVRSAREGMDWLQDIAKIVGKVGERGSPLTWTSASGFLVYQKDCRVKSKQVKTSISCIKSYRVQSVTNEIDTVALRNGSAPNYVHSQDAAHLVLTILECPEDINLQMIHDEFGTHAADIPILHKAIRQAFIDMYSGYDRLAMFRDEVSASVPDTELPESPTMGDMDVTNVGNSLFFFG